MKSRGVLGQKSLPSVLALIYFESSDGENNFEMGITLNIKS